MASFNVQFDITVSGIGSRTVVVSVATATDAEDAIQQAKANLVLVIPTGVLRTAP